MSPSLTFALVFVCFFVLALFETVFGLKRGKNEVAVSLATLLAVLLVVCCCLPIIEKDWLSALIGGLSYFCLAFIVKLFLARLVLKKAPVEGIKRSLSKFRLCDIQLLFVSPDYVASKLCKDGLWKSEGDKRKNLVKAFNYGNILLTFFFVALICPLSYFLFPPLNAFLYALGYRVISRSIEVIVSFVADVCTSSIPKSTLTKNERIALAFLSILEMVVLAFGVGFCSLAKSGHALSEAATNALLLIGSLPSLISLGQCASGGVIAQTFCGLACFALLGIVIGAYLGTGSCLKKPIPENPVLLVIKDNHVQNVLEFQEKDGSYEYHLGILNDPACRYCVKDGDSYFGFDKCHSKEFIHKADKKTDFSLDGDDVFEIVYDKGEGCISITDKSKENKNEKN